MQSQRAEICKKNEVNGFQSQIRFSEVLPATLEKTPTYYAS
jgi:hypothetical protein